MSKLGDHTIPTPEVIDGLSLEQALLDADIAIARARDLMLRLVELRQELAGERARSRALADDLNEVTNHLAAVQANRAYKAASRVWAIRRALGV